MPNNQEQRALLVRKRAAIKASFTRLANFFKDLTDNDEQISQAKILELETRLASAESELLCRFNEIQFELEEIDLENFDQSETANFEKACYSLFGEIKSVLLIARTPVESSNVGINPGSSNTRNCPKVGVKYPIIELPKFTGIYEKWLEFKELYLALIHNNDELNSIAKFHYLRASLEGSAAQCIQSIDFSADNYSTAWDALKSRFDKKQLIVHKHMKNLFNIHEVKPESPASFRQLIDTMSNNLKSLESLKINTDSWDPVINYLVTSKLDIETLSKWDEQEFEGELPTIAELKTFLSDRADFLDKLNMHKSKNSKSAEKSQVKQKSFLPKSLSKNSEKSHKFSCYYCQQSHSIYKCSEFLALSSNQKYDKIIELKLCTNCLQSGHQMESCKYGNCRLCQQKHNSLLHPGRSNSNIATTRSIGKTDSVEISMDTSVQQGRESTCCNLSSGNQVLLATAQVSVLDSRGHEHTCKALLDNGSMSNFISQALIDKLGLAQEKINFSVLGIGQCQSRLSTSCNVSLNSLQSDYQTTLHCLVIPEITDKLPSFGFNPKSLNIPANIELSDPTFFQPNKIDLLIGADTYWSLIEKDNIQLGKGNPVLQKTKLGWVVSGPLGSSRRVVTSCHFSKNSELQNQLTKFWEIEEISNTSNLSNEDDFAETHFSNTCKRAPEGRFIVSIPLKEPVTKLGESKELAIRQFFGLERKLALNPKQREMYCDFMNEYKHSKHMTPFNPVPNQVTYFAPHHGFLREESITTQLRVVFNCSAESSSGYSYNSIQVAGPTVQEDLFSILVRFRQHAFVVSADISKMYRQIKIAEEFRPLQLIVWREHPEDELQTYSINRVAYGTTSAPFLATRCLLQLAIEHKNSYPQAAQVIKRDIYVDDLLSGADSKEGLVSLATQVSSILQSGCFELRKWKSNNPLVLEGLKPVSSSTDSFFFAPSDTSKTLGLFWSCMEDTFSFQIRLPSQKKRVTKRTILSETASIFDPLGLISPVTICAKVMMQSLWSLKLSWDQEVPKDISDHWKEFKKNILELHDLKIPRHVSCLNPISIQIHGFSDSSQKAYGAVLYLRIENEENEVFVNLITSKTRVAPLQTLSIPRLELCAAVLLTQLLEKTTTSLTLRYDGKYLWSDSTVALAWIRSSPKILQPFVGNRVAIIQKLSEISKWRYVPTTSNPADILSRGMSPKNLINSTKWFHGPSWLKHSEENWPEDISISIPVNELPEVKKHTKSFVQTNQELFPFNRFSSLARLKRVFAFVLRFNHNCKKENEKLSGSLSVDEIRNAMHALCQISQRETFGQEISDLNHHQEVGTKSKILSLTPFMRDGVIRVGGRLKHSTYCFDKKHPIVLSSKHHLTYLICRAEHFKLLHCGPQMLLASVRENYWPISGKNLANENVWYAFGSDQKFIYH